MEYDRDRIQIKTIQNSIDFSNKHVLEIGCGDGKISVLLALGTKTYTAIDLDRELIDQAKNLNSKVIFGTGSGENLEFETDFFDIVLFTLSLHHQNSQSALEEAFRVLSPTGYVLVLEPLANGEFQQFFHLFDDETLALEKAISAIETSRFEWIKTLEFYVIVAFEDIQDLCACDFSRPRIKHGDEKKILDLICRLQRTFLPDLSNTDQAHRSIFLKDELQMFVLKKGL